MPITSSLLVAIVASTPFSGSSVSALTSSASTSAFSFVSVKLTSKKFVFCDVRGNDVFYSNGLIVAKLNASQLKQSQVLVQLPGSKATNTSATATRHNACSVESVRYFDGSWKLLGPFNKSHFSLHNCSLTTTTSAEVFSGMEYVVLTLRHNTSTSKHPQSYNVLLVLSSLTTSTLSSSSSPALSRSLTIALAVISCLFLLLLIAVCLFLVCSCCRRCSGKGDEWEDE